VGVSCRRKEEGAVAQAVGKKSRMLIFAPQRQGHTRKKPIIGVEKKQLKLGGHYFNLGGVCEQAD